jgi:alpha-L-rhamnosidase
MRQILLRIVLLPLFALALLLPVTPVASSPQDQIAIQFAHKVYLPSLHIPDSFNTLPALWAHGAAQPPPKHEVVLLRCTLNLDMPLAQAELALFADTRYEAWLNGAFVGRGPTRFSEARREYDLFSLGQLTAGRHVIAVLAQWAPNLRRSESLQPQVQLQLSGESRASAFRFRLGPEQCRAITTPAWRSDSAAIHAWNILGPSEQLDLRLLPSTWQQPDFADTAWPPAVLRTTRSAAIYQPRSIPALVNVPMPVQLQSAGLLTPNFWVGELTVNSGAAYEFILAAPTTVTLMALASPTQPIPATAVTLNGEALVWTAVAEGVPDLVMATRQLPTGSHQLRVAGLEAFTEGWVFAISRTAISSPPPPLGQGANPGRRMLITELVRDDQIAQLTPAGSGVGLDLRLTHGPAYVVLDLGRTVHGRVNATISGPPGTLVDIGWDERLWQGVRPLPSPGSLHPEWSQADAWVLAATPRALSTLDTRTGRYVLITVWGEGPVELRNLQILEERYPVTLRGSFQSEQARLNQIWEVGIATLYPSMLDAYVDPWRERGQWWGDAYIADHVNRVSFGEFGLLRRGIQQMADSVYTTGEAPAAFVPTGLRSDILFDYAMRWVQSCYEYGRLTNDWSFVAELYPAIQLFMATLARHEHPETGLLTINRPDLAWGGLFIDSSSYWDRYGQSTAANAYYYRTLQDAAALATALGHSYDAASWSQRATQLRLRANQLLYIPANGHYMAGIFEGEYLPPTPQAQAAALAFDLPPDGEAQRVADALLATLGTPERPILQILGMYSAL